MRLKKLMQNLFKELASLKAEVSAMKASPKESEEKLAEAESVVSGEAEGAQSEEQFIGNESTEELHSEETLERNQSTNKLKIKGAKGKKTVDLKLKAEKNQDDAAKLQETAVMMDDFDDLKETKGKSKRKSSKTRSFVDPKKAKLARTRLSKEDQQRLKKEAAEQAKKIKLVIYGICGLLLVAMIGALIFLAKK